MTCFCRTTESGHFIPCAQHRPQRTERYAAPRVEQTYQRETWECQCIDSWTGRRLSRLRRHTEPHQCVPDVAVEDWRARHPEATCSDRSARVMTWLERCHRGRA